MMCPTMLVDVSVEPSMDDRGVSYHANGCECWAFLTYMIGLVPLIVRCECWSCLSDMVLDVFLSWSDVSVGKAIMT